METRVDSGGGLTIDAAKAFSAIADRVSLCRWPAESREAFFGPQARLHAKCVVADRSIALITSANLTSAGINDNIELGVLIASGPLPGQLADHFDDLIALGTLQET